MSAGETVKKIGNYELTGRKLGEGSFARVGEAVHGLVKAKVAVKIIDTTTVKEEYVLRNLEREARVLSLVSHPCIVYIYETIQYRSLYCIVTELLPGKDLADFMSEQPGGRLNERTTRRFVRQLASALEHMHARGIVHRDLKMQNIVVDIQQHLLKIIDFGLSNFWSMEEPLSTHCGSPEYAAPELFVHGRKYGPEVDLWSLGVIVFCMSAGCLPFSLDEKEQSLSFDHQTRLLVSRIRKGILQRHRNLISHFSKDFDILIAGLLKTNPKQRYRVEQVLSHSWTTKSRSLLLDIPKTIKPEKDFHGKIILRLCNILDMMPRDVDKKLMCEPLGPLGGMYRILYHKELQNHWQLLETFSPNTLSNSQSFGSLVTRTRKKKSGTSNISKVKSNEVCKVTFNIDHVTPSKEMAYAAENQNSFSQEPWSGNLSSIVNDQISLVVAPLRSTGSPYNYRRYSHITEQTISCKTYRSADISSTETSRTSARSENNSKSSRDKIKTGQNL